MACVVVPSEDESRGATLSVCGWKIFLFMRLVAFERGRYGDGEGLQWFIRTRFVSLHSDSVVLNTLSSGDREVFVKAMEEATPGQIQKYSTVVNSKRYPIKHVFSAGTGLCKIDFTASDANRLLRKYRFRIDVVEEESDSPNSGRENDNV
jgi:hypothetical protein